MIKVYKNIKDILQLLEKKEIRENYSPYYNLNYISFYSKNAFILNKIKGVYPYFIYFSDKDTHIVLPLEKKRFRNEYQFFGCGSGIGYQEFLSNQDIQVEDLKRCFKWFFEKHKKAIISLRNYIGPLEIVEFLQGLSIKYSTEVCVKIPANRVLSKNMRQNIRTANNRIIKDGHKVEFVNLDINNQNSEMFKSIIKLYLDRLKKYKHINILEKLYFSFFDSAFKSIKNVPNSQIVVVLIDGYVASFAFLLSNKKHYVCPRLAIGSQFYKYSPGIILLEYLHNEICILNKYNSIDLMQGEEVYKIKLGGEKHHVYSFEINNFF